MREIAHAKHGRVRTDGAKYSQVATPDAYNSNLLCTETMRPPSHGRECLPRFDAILQSMISVASIEMEHGSTVLTQRRRMAPRSGDFPFRRAATYHGPVQMVVPTTQEAITHTNHTTIGSEWLVHFSQPYLTLFRYIYI